MRRPPTARIDFLPQLSQMAADLWCRFIGIMPRERDTAETPHFTASTLTTSGATRLMASSTPAFMVMALMEQLLHAP